MSEILARNMLLFAGEMFVISAVVLALAWEGAHLFRHRAALRHLVWLGAFAALIVLPVLAAVLPSHVHFMLAAPSLPQPVAQTQVADAAPAAAAPVAVSAPHMPTFHFDIGFAARVIAMLWLAGLLVIALRSGFALLALRKLKRDSRAHRFDDIALPEGRYEIRLARAPGNCGPVTWGVLRPVILLPFQAQFWPSERLRAVLMHEVAHIRRHDGLSQLLSMLVCAFYWLNPLVWAAARSLRAEAEMAADDTVLASGVRPSSYAGELLQLASEYRSREPALAGMPLFMAGSALEARVKSVLAATPQRSGVTKMDVLKICGAAVLAAAALTFARPTFAQEETSPPALPVPATVATAPLPPVSATGPAPAARPAPAPVVHAHPASPSPVAATQIETALPAPAPVAAAMPVVRAHPVVNVRTIERTQDGQTIRHIVIDADVTEPSPQDLARMHAEIARAMAAAREAQPRITEARRQLLRQQETLRELQANLPEIQAQVQAELAKVQPQIDRAIAEARLNHLDLKIRENIDEAMKRAELRIEMRKANGAGDGEDDAAGQDK